MNQHQSEHKFLKPTGAFIAASWSSLLGGISAFLIGLQNSELSMNEKGYYFTLLLYGLFSAVSLQKIVRDRLEGIVVTNIYYGISWVSLIASILLVSIGLWSSSMLASEKGFYALAFILSLFAAITVQKNIRDLALHPKNETTVDEVIVDE
jgi:uncharacterized membrane protein YiaA